MGLNPERPWHVSPTDLAHPSSGQSPASRRLPLMSNVRRHIWKSEHQSAHWLITRERLMRLSPGSSATGKGSLMYRK